MLKYLRPCTHPGRLQVLVNRCLSTLDIHPRVNAMTGKERRQACRTRVGRHRPTHTAAMKAKAEHMLRDGDSVASVSASTGIGYRTVYRIRSGKRIPSRETAQVLASRTVIGALKERVEKLEGQLTAERKRHQDTYARERRKDQALRTMRKGDRWQKLAFRLGYGLYDVLPESVWIALMAGHVVKAEFSGAALVTAQDSEAWIAIDDDYIEDMRTVLALREGIECDDDAMDVDDHTLRERFARQYRIELEAASSQPA